MSSIVIRQSEIYHPDKIIKNDYFIEKMKEDNKDLEGFLKALGRDRRYIGENENSLTLAIKASKKALFKSSLKGEELDMIVFSSATPEYLSPPTSAIIHRALQGKNTCIVYDINVNCSGMIVALDQVSRYMQSNSNIKRALIVGAEQVFRFSKTTDIITHPNFGDASCAIILEKVPQEGIGFIDSEHYVDSSLSFEIKNPSCGLSQIFDTDSDSKKIYWSPFDTDNAFESAKNTIEQLLYKNGFEKEHVKKYFLSQFSIKNIRDISNELNEDIQKFKYIGDEFGYTGTTSPFIAFTKSLTNGELKNDDVVVFWSVGAGVTACTVIYKHISNYNSISTPINNLPKSS